MAQSSPTSGFVTANGIRLHYLDWGGSGPVLLFLPGLGCNAYIFKEFAPRFTGHFHVLALTRRGHGDSDYPETGYDINTLVEDIRQFLDSQGSEQAILAGHSLAGIELAHFAALHPERVLKLVFLDATQDYACPEYKTLIETNPIRKIQIPGADQDYYSLEEYATFIKFAYPTLGTIWGDMFDEHLRHDVAISPDGKVVDRMSDEIGMAIRETQFAYQPEYDKIRAPTLSINAIKPNTYYVADYMTPEQQAAAIEFFDKVAQPWNLQSIEKFRREAPHARIVELPDAHHYIFIPQADQVYDEMMSFLLG